LTVTELIEALAPASARVVRLFGVPHLTHSGMRAEIPEGSKRVVAFIALRSGGVDRRVAGRALWPDVDDERAAGNLRSSLWRLGRNCPTLIVADRGTLRLADGVLSDADVAVRWAFRIIDGCHRPGDMTVRPGQASAVDLLPGYYEDWALEVRERVRQILLRGFEVLSRELLLAGYVAPAVDAALAVIAVDPLRESAHQALVEAHLAEGNWAEGQRAFESYRRRLETDLGVEPGPAFRALVMQG
jgi:DNA-binding SARP family transcriptional activator